MVDMKMESHFTIYIDLGNINSYLALKPTLDLIHEFDLDVNWLPISGIVKTVANRKPVISVSDDLAEIKLKRLDARSRYEARELERNAAHLGISVRAAGHSFNPKYLHIAILYINQCSMSPEYFIQNAFDKAFHGEMDIENSDYVSRLIDSAGLESSAYLDYLSEGENELSELQATTLSQGIFDAPAYQFRNENYQGRAHLPLIKWYLNGSVGSPPT